MLVGCPGLLVGMAVQVVGSHLLQGLVGLAGCPLLLEQMVVLLPGLRPLVRGNSIFPHDFMRVHLTLPRLEIY